MPSLLCVYEQLILYSSDKRSRRSLLKVVTVLEMIDCLVTSLNVCKSKDPLIESPLSNMINAFSFPSNL